MNVFYKSAFLLLLLIAQLSTATDSYELQYQQAYSAYKEHSQAERWEESLPYAKKVYELRPNLFEDNHKNTPAIVHNYALNLGHVGESKKAYKIFKKAIQSYERVYGENAVELIQVLMDTGSAVAFEVKIGALEKYFKRAIATTKLHFGGNSVDHGQRLVGVGVSLLIDAKSKKSKPYLFEGHKILSEQLGGNHPQTIYARHYLGQFELAMQKPKRALKHLNIVLNSLQKTEQPTRKMELATHTLLVKAYESVGQRDKATTHCLAIGQMTPTDSNQEYEPILKVPPIYPMSAIRRGKTGEVIVEYRVDEMGIVRNPKVVENKGDRSFDKASINAALQFRYAPTFKDGKPVVTEGVRNTFTFTIGR